MTSPHLSIDEFFTRLSVLFKHLTPPHHGSIHLTQKPFTYDSSSSTQPKLLVRATNGLSKAHRSKSLAASEGVEKEKVKLSTVVEGDAISRFYERYAEVCKAGMAGGLKRRDRSGRKKARGKKVKKVG